MGKLSHRDSKWLAQFGCKWQAGFAPTQSGSGGLSGRNFTWHTLTEFLLTGKKKKGGGGWFSQIIRSPSYPAGIQSEPTFTPPATMQGESVLSTQLVKGKDTHFRHKIWEPQVHVLLVKRARPTSFNSEGALMIFTCLFLFVLYDFVPNRTLNLLKLFY